MHKRFYHPHTIYHENNKANLKPDCFKIFLYSLWFEEEGTVVNRKSLFMKAAPVSEHCLQA